MRHFQVEVFGDARPVVLEAKTFAGSDHGVAAGKGYRAAKKFLRRGVRQVTIRVTALQSVRNEKVEEEYV